jgi:hypothetical protein
MSAQNSAIPAGTAILPPSSAGAKASYVVFDQSMNARAVFSDKEAAIAKCSEMSKTFGYYLQINTIPLDGFYVDVTFDKVWDSMSALDVGCCAKHARDKDLFCLPADLLKEAGVKLPEGGPSSVAAAAPAKTKRAPKKPKKLAESAQDSPELQ